ncbi:DUF3263 domain-containing protein [Blastococcus sp. CCUG 61487]|uniref:DUF3263 domain-containing protein n=1 Tax=Blastococcus sp. CCUG 61487 TaxID=1840703 RepID=UPI00113BA774|nr:DUF3263 domain-containing protein [Blastococcus sp. CCUG 61487]TKJ24353.1 hypothetical protein A6V29_04975 [Blastococcus sp. CCUG 61487]
MPLDPDDLGILRFERQHWRDSWSKGQAIAEQFGLTPVRYYQRLSRIIDTPDALAEDPVLVHRLRRLRASRLSYRDRQDTRG